MTPQRIRVLTGSPDRAELAALTIAVMRLQDESVPQPQSQEPSRWIRAARLEGRGHPPIDSPMRLTR